MSDVAGFQRNHARVDNRPFVLLQPRQKVSPRSHSGCIPPLKAEGYPDPEAAYPILIDTVGRCPPEDVGGPPGYEEFLEAIADPEHERHAEMHEWLGVSFDPQYVDPSEISQALQQTARRWRRKTTPGSTRP